MKSDVLTLAAVIFVIGLVASGLGVMDLFHPESTAPPGALQQGVMVSR